MASTGTTHHAARRRGLFDGAFPFVVVGVFFASLVAGVLVSATRSGDEAVAVPAANIECPETLRVYASPDIAGVLSELLPPTVAEDCDVVQVIAESSADMVDNLTAGWDVQRHGPAPHVWVPESTSFVRLLEADEQARALVPEERPSVARSPTVIAMPRPMAAALGWPRTRLGWEDIADLVQEPEGWASVGHPEWGLFQLAMTEPRNSAHATHALLSVGAAFGDVWADELSSEAFSGERIRLNLLQLERSLGRTDNTTLELLSALRRADGAGQALELLSAFPIDERNVWRYNTGLPPGTADDEIRLPPPEVPLSAVYPAEGNIPLDYPYLVLEVPWADAGTRGRADEFFDVVADPAAQRRLMELGFRGRDGEIGKVLADAEGITPARAGLDIDAPEPAVVREVLSTWDTLSQLTNTLAVIDVSGSMVEAVPGTDDTRLEVAAEAAIEAVELSVDDSQFGLWEFSTDLGGEDEHHRELVPLGPLGDNVGGEQRRAALVDALRSMDPEADTALYETVLAAYREARAAFDPERVNNVVLLTDGRQDNPDGDLNLQQTIRQLEEEVDPDQPIGLIAIGFGDSADLDALEQLADVTDGRVYGTDSARDVQRVLLQALTG